MDLVPVAIAVAAAAVAAPVLRVQIFRYAVPPGRAVRRACPVCDRPLLVGLPASGRCPGCGHRVGPRPGAVEAVAAVAVAVPAATVGDLLPLLAVAWVAALGVVLAFVDVAERRLPDRLTLAAFVGALAVLAIADRPARLAGAAVGATAMTATYVLLVLARPAGMGPGDAKLAPSLGLVAGWYGWSAVLAATVAGLVFAGLYAAGMLALRRIGRHDHLPHGPFMLAGTLAVVALQ